MYKVEMNFGIAVAWAMACFVIGLVNNNLTLGVWLFFGVPMVIAFIGGIWRATQPSRDDTTRRRDRTHLDYQDAAVYGGTVMKFDLVPENIRPKIATEMDKSTWANVPFDKNSCEAAVEDAMLDDAGPAIRWLAKAEILTGQQAQTIQNKLDDIRDQSAA